MPATEKFMFDRSFDLPDIPVEEEVIEESEPEEPEIVIPTFSEEEVNAARDEGFAQGRDQGIREASEATERLISETTQAIDVQLAQLFDQQRDANTKIFQEAINTGVAVAKKCFPHLNAKSGISEIEHIIGEILGQILEEPRVVINIHADLKTPLGERMQTITENAHYDGRIVIREDAKIAPGDCHIEWSNGGAERNMSELWQQIDQIVASNLAGEKDDKEGASSSDLALDTPSDEGRPIQQDMDTNNESSIENEAEMNTSASTSIEEPAPADLSQRDGALGQDSQDGPPPTPFVSDEEEAQNMQNTAPFEPSEPEDTPPSPASEPERSTLSQEDVNTAEQPPLEHTEDASVEPDAETGIVAVNADLETSDSPEQSA